MDELKRSLEEAIKELQEVPAAAPANPLPKTADPLPKNKKSILEQALAAGPVIAGVPDFDPEPVLPSRPPSVRVTTAPVTHVPAPNSIEAALATAPAVSPRYVPPPSVPAPSPPAGVSSPPISRSVSSEMPTQAPVTQAPITRPPTTVAHEEVAPIVAAPVLPRPLTHRERAVSTAVEQSVQRVSREVEEGIAAISGVRPVSTPVEATTFQAEEPPVARVNMIETAVEGVPAADRQLDLTKELAEQAKKLRDRIWRWATIAVSCAGGLASGWIGSNFSDQANGLFQMGTQVITDKSSNIVSIKSPANVKLAGAGKPNGVARHMTGKTDRAVPIDENHCTVLERDRRTGLTLAKPCKLIETAGFTSTLDKSDLLAKPR